MDINGRKLHEKYEPIEILLLTLGVEDIVNDLKVIILMVVSITVAKNV